MPKPSPLEEGRRPLRHRRGDFPSGSLSGPPPSLIFGGHPTALPLLFRQYRSMSVAMSMGLVTSLGFTITCAVRGPGRRRAVPPARSASSPCARLGPMHRPPLTPLTSPSLALSSSKPKSPADDDDQLLREGRAKIHLRLRAGARRIPDPFGFRISGWAFRFPSFALPSPAAKAPPRLSG